MKVYNPPVYRSSQIEELTLKSQGATDLRILFDEPWLVQVGVGRCMRVILLSTTPQPLQVIARHTHY